MKSQIIETTLLALVAIATCAPSSNKPPFLNLITKQNDKLYFGTATNNVQLNDTAYAAILDDSRMFGQITAANSMKWFDTEPERGHFTFQDGDVIRDLAKRNGQLLRGHNCVWHNQLPDWVANGSFTKPDLLDVVKTHCGTLVGHYRDSWDIVNEVLNDDGTFREDIFFNTTGSEYIPTAFHAARAADPHAKLYANDFNIEGINAKSEAYRNLIPQLRKQGVPIDGIGIQSHLIVGQLPTDMKENMEAFTAIGLEVAITELDIRMTLPETEELLEQQKKDYATVIEACNAVKGCVGITVWDFSDKYSWVPGSFAGQGAACPWDENMKEKPAFFGIVEGFLG
ncbi:endo-beta-1,4-glucanase [Abortiporus biennis]|nr:endo-beta-1,4-glucanase [Abortiporus biennis]